MPEGMCVCCHSISRAGWVTCPQQQPSALPGQMLQELQCGSFQASDIIQTIYTVAAKMLTWLCIPDFDAL